jgi:hypothetical protein
VIVRWFAWTRPQKQLVAETRVPMPMKAGRPARFDYEYQRNGTANSSRARALPPTSG